MKVFVNKLETHNLEVTKNSVKGRKFMMMHTKIEADIELMDLQK